MNKTIWRIYHAGCDRTIEFAAQELQRYLGLLLLDAIVEIGIADSAVPSAPFDLTAPSNLDASDPTALSQINDIYLAVTPYSGPLSEQVCAFDDEICIEATDRHATLGGCNPRSVLLAVYRYLREQGFRWLRPGPEGEYAPIRVAAPRPVSLRERPSYRHRGICIEGSVSYENLRDMIDWMPKAGFNGYFIQFREAYTFFDRWYSHLHNPTLPPEPFSIEQARELVRQAVHEIQKRNLIYHAVGHGWTCEPLGIPGLSWDPQVVDIKPEIRSYLAEVNGERALWQNIALNTNLCYANPTVQDMMVKEIVDYVAQHRHIDVLHFWLADMFNNQCECSRCSEALPSDFYVAMLNELDRRLTDRGLDVKIVFLIYFELLWPPLAQRIAHPERFILMFAPITRTYTRAFSADGPAVPVPPFARNNLAFSSGVENNLAFLRAWQDVFQGDSFDFDYHVFTDHFNDPGNDGTAKILHEDIRNLRSIGMNGYMSCQVQRAFFPTGLLMQVLGSTLWNADLAFDEIADDYYRHAFGDDGALCKPYLQALSELFHPPYLREEEERTNPPLAAKFAEIPALVESFKSVVDRNLAAALPPVQAKSWVYLQIHGPFARLFSQTLAAKARGDERGMHEAWRQLEAYLQKNETRIQPVFDVFEFIHEMNTILLETSKPVQP
ncbi:DUF4838 domain-containing protein [Cohnella sp. GCM10020058]|uniref:DUF4838 domain-containing protein n=1 Tax=Cohnella sp. GCM10020058 TaxID=3317330 RepID=UPI003636141E